MHNHGYRFDPAKIPSQSLELLLNSKLNQVTELVIEYISLFGAEQKKFTGSLFLLLQSLKENTLDNGKRLLLTVTDFFYKQVLLLDENPHLNSILEIKNNCDISHLISKIERDVKHRLSRLNICMTNAMNQMDNVYRVTFALRKLRGDCLSIEIAQKISENSEDDSIIQFSVFENGIETVSIKDFPNDLNSANKLSASSQSVDLALKYTLKLIQNFKNDSLNEIRDCMDLLSFIGL